MAPRDFSKTRPRPSLNTDHPFDSCCAETESLLRAPVARQSLAARGRLRAVDSGSRLPTKRERSAAGTPHGSAIPASEAEGEGFEPSTDGTADNGFRDRLDLAQHAG